MWVDGGVRKLKIYQRRIKPKRKEQKINKWRFPTIPCVFVH
jgi:hypothetical protein